MDEGCGARRTGYDIGELGAEGEDMVCNSVPLVQRSCMSEESLASRRVNSAYIAGNLYNCRIRSLTLRPVFAQIGPWRMLRGLWGLWPFIEVGYVAGLAAKRPFHAV